MMNRAAAAPGVTRTSSGVTPSALRPRSRAQPGPAQVIPVQQHEIVERHVQIAQRRVGHGALGEVEADPVVAELLGRLGLDGHAAVVHRRRIGPATT